MRCSFLAAICIPEELLFTGAVARRSPSVASFSFQARLSRLKTNKPSIELSATIPFGTVTFCLWSLQCGPLPGWRCWILTAILLHGGSSGLGPGPQEGQGAELKMRASLLHTGASLHQEQITSTSRASIPPSVAWGSRLLFARTLKRIRARPRHATSSVCQSIIHSARSHDHFSMAIADEDCSQEGRMSSCLTILGLRA